MGQEITKVEADLVLGNIFAVRPGKNPGPATYAGSHLDTQVISRNL